MRDHFAAAWFLLLGACASATEPASQLDDVAGFYASSPLDVLEVEPGAQMISAVPPFWGSKPYFERVSNDTFAMTLPDPRPERRITFQRDEAGAASSVVLTNIEQRYDGQVFRRLTPHAPIPALLFLNRQPAEAARAALADVTLTPDALANFALRHFLNHPTRHADTVAFLAITSAAHPQHAGLRALYGYTLVSQQRRDEARAVLSEALALDPAEPVALEGARRLDFTEPGPGEGYRAVLPFRLTDAYASPSNAEVAAVRTAWGNLDLAPRNAAIVHRYVLALAHATFDVAIVRHRVGDAAHIGAVLTPQGAASVLPLIIDVGGVDLSYTPRDISTGTTTLRALGPTQERFVTIIPAMRGNTLIADGRRFSAEGDPSDAWAGAATDTLAFLNVALEISPRADPNRIAVIGYSRGGTVALLAGERDPRISLVLNVAGPVDHFRAQSLSDGWSWAEILADTMRDGEPADVSEEGGQMFDHFFDRVGADGETLAQVRMRMLASSPLDFAESLPETHSYYGAEDRYVPIANAIALQQRLGAPRRPDADSTIQIFNGRGHDTDPLMVQRATAAHLNAWADRTVQ
jgi:predicted esterase